MAQSQPVETISIDATKITGNIEPVWNGIGGASGLALTPQGERLLQRIANSSPYPFYKRIWGITSTGTAVPFTAEADWGSTNVYQVGKNGIPFYDFTLFDQILDVVLKQQFIPIMHLGLMPDSLSSAPDSIRRLNENLVKYPPKDYDKWYDLIYHIVKHCVERYGGDEVVKWKWEMWNEPDITNYWMGTEAEFHKMYDYTASAVKAALPKAQVGGNSVTQSIERGTPVLVRFIEHCLSGKNYKNDSIGTPLDFITFHVKGTNFAISKLGNFTSKALAAGTPKFSPSVAFIRETAATNLAKIASVNGTKGIPIFITEGDIDIGLNVTTTENPAVEYRNTEYHAAFQCAFARAMIELSDQFPSNPVRCIVFDGLFNPGYRIFEGQRTLFTAEEIEKPVFNSFRLLGKLGRERIQMTGTEIGIVDGIATRAGNNVQVMIYNYNESVDDKEVKKIRMSLILPVRGSYSLKHYRIDEHHSNAYTVWQAMGSPYNPTNEQIRKIKSGQGLELLEPQQVINGSNARITLAFEMPHHSVSLLEFELIR